MGERSLGSWGRDGLGEHRMSSVCIARAGIRDQNWCRGTQNGKAIRCDWFVLLLTGRSGARPPGPADAESDMWNLGAVCVLCLACFLACFGVA